MAKVRQMRHDIASLLQKDQEATARIRVLIISKVSSFFLLVYQVLFELLAILSTRKSCHSRLVFLLHIGLLFLFLFFVMEHLIVLSGLCLWLEK